MATKLPQPLPPNYHEFVSACFLGPRAENYDKLQEIFEGVLKSHAETRMSYHPEDKNFITQAIKDSEEFQNTMKLTGEQVQLVSGWLSKYSVPFFSPRYMGHMCMETSVPALAGWLMTILYNPNNVAFEASPITTIIELQVGEQLCEMLGYEAKNDETPWGHLAADGTIANMESMCSARNLKFYPLSLHAAMTRGNKPLAFIADEFKVTTCDDPVPRLFSTLDTWQLLNLAPSVILSIPDQLLVKYSISADFLAQALSPYLAQTEGKNALMKMYNVTVEPKYFVPSTKHYSWPKAAALVGIGSGNCVNVPVDLNARMDIHELEKKLQACLDAQQPVYCVVAVIGSTEEGAVDPLHDIVRLRDEFATKGMSFVIHADAAWGGYFASMIRQPKKVPYELPDRGYVPSITLRPSTVDQFKALGMADSITIDPHKSGYIPYPAGGLCYRDGRMRHLLTWSAPYLNQGEGGMSIGIYGIEGRWVNPVRLRSRASYTTASLGLDTKGHGALLGEVCWTSRRFGAHWATMSDDKTDFIVEPFNALEDESYKVIIREGILPKSNKEIVEAEDQKPYQVLCTLASELNINVFACNFRINGKVNDDVEEANALNKRIFARFSMTRPEEDKNSYSLFLSSTVFGQEDYGECVRNLQRRMGLETDSRQDLYVLRNVVMSPFQSAGNFVEDLANEFQRVLKEEVKLAISRNTIQAQVHEFIMQGASDLYLAYRPLFHNANGRQQVILHAKIQSEERQQEYQRARSANPGDVYKLATSAKTTMEQILENMEFKGTISGPGTAPLNSRYRDAHYPASYTPFYIYGSPDKTNLDHMLTRAPNAQIISDGVALDVQPRLSAEQLLDGAIARALLPEEAMQPFSTKHMPFQPEAMFPVEIFTDTGTVDAKGPRLAYGGTCIAKGTLTMGKMVFVDCDQLNQEGFSAVPAVKANVVEEWSDIVAASFGKANA
ncbi:PLP-dependent transferase [Mycena amicta]|nr:PLP-dependent transferase [Mycena amicta]